MEKLLQAGFCLRPGGLKGLLTQNIWIGEVMLLIRAELLVHEYDLATQSCIEPGPSGDLRNTEKHHVATKRFARLAGIHCTATRHLRATLCSVLIHSQWKQQSFRVKKKKKVVTYFNQMVQVRWCGGGARFLSCIICSRLWVLLTLGFGNKYVGFLSWGTWNSLLMKDTSKKTQWG